MGSQGTEFGELVDIACQWQCCFVGEAKKMGEVPFPPFGFVFLEFELQTTNFVCFFATSTFDENGRLRRKDET